MAELSDTAWIESRKAIRSGMPIWTALGSTIAPLGIAFLIFVARNPEVSQQLGLVGAKANLTAYSATDWTTYLRLLGQVVAAAGFVLFVLVHAWVFGREFADGTVKDLLAVPVRRSSILLGKFLVVAVWSALLTAIIFAVGIVGGAIVRLPGGSVGVVLEGGVATAVIGCMTVAVSLPFALVASAGRGYLPPVGAAVLAAMLTNFVALVGFGEYFPWAVPGLYAQARDTLTPVSYLLVLLTGLAGMIGTYLWWKLADQNR